MNSKSLESLIVQLKAKIKREPNNSELYQKLGTSYRKNKQFSKSKLAYERAIKLDPKDLWNHLYLGSLFYAQENYLCALREFDVAAKLDPKESMAYVSIADAYSCLGQIELADRYYKKAVKIDPNSSIAKKNLKRWRGVVKKREPWGKQYNQSLQLTGVIAELKRSAI